MSLNFHKLSRFCALPAALFVPWLEARVAFAQATPGGTSPPTPPASATAPPAPPSSAAPQAAPGASPNQAAGSGANDEEVTVEAAPATAPSPPPITQAPTTAPAAPAPAVATNRGAPGAEVPPGPAAAASSTSSTDGKPEESESGTDSILDRAGYTLTPGVSSLPYSHDFVFSGYLQSQYEYHQDSSDQLDPSGASLNKNRFVLRRGRFLIVRDWQWAQIRFELDGNTVNGPTVRVQKAEASLIYGRSKDKDQPPIAELTMGEFDLPFGFELPYVPKVRWFMERTQASRALWPGEPDLGVRFAGGFGFARYAIAITNGEPLDEKSGFQLQDPNSNKDVTARFGAESKPRRDFVIAGGISYNRGKGFSKGQVAAKNVLTWSDSNGDGRVELNELTGNYAAAAQPSQNFSRWAVGADLEVLLRTKLGWSMLYAEIVGATNLDRGLYVADPIATGKDVRELGYYVAFTQEITQYGIVGFRYDYYDPNADLFEQRAANLVPVAARIYTLSPLAGLVLPNRARLLFQYDVINDRLGRDARGVPADFKNNEWTLRLQVNL